MVMGEGGLVARLSLRRAGIELPPLEPLIVLDRCCEAKRESLRLGRGGVAHLDWGGCARIIGRGADWGPGSWSGLMLVWLGLI